jgi:hypothetical protein
VRAFFAPGLMPEMVAGRERFGAGAGAVSVAELAQRAEALAPLSVKLTDSTAARLDAEEVGASMQASVSLLAKALTDLEVSRALLHAAEEEPVLAAPGLRSLGAERSAPLVRPAHLEQTLQLLVGDTLAGEYLAGETLAGALEAERGATRPKTVAAARTQLAGDAETALLLIRDRAASAGWEALGGIAGMGLGQLTQAAGLAGMEVAELLGQAAQVTRLVELVRGFLSEAVRSLQALLGPAVLQAVGGQVVDWLKEAATEKRFSHLLERLYATGPAAKALATLIKESPADLEHFIGALQGVEALELAYRKQVELVGKLLKVLKTLRAPLATALPQGTLVFVAIYLLIGGYVVLAGGDYVDAERLKRIDRVPGVRKVVEMKLVQVS